MQLKQSQVFLELRKEFALGLTIAAGLTGSVGASELQPPSQQSLSGATFSSTPWIRTAEETTLISVNDGQSHLKIDPSYLKLKTPLSFERTNFTADSFTVVKLGPDHPPIVKTVYNTVPNTIMGPPYLAMSPNGRFAFVTCHNDGAFDKEAGNIISVIDLCTPDFKVIQKVPVEAPQMACLHPDGIHLVVPCAGGFNVYKIHEDGISLESKNKVGGFPTSMAISPDGNRIVASLDKAYGNSEFIGVHVFSYQEGKITHSSQVTIDSDIGKFDKPFSMRFSPDGTRVLSLNAGGQGSKGTLDDILSIDMTLRQPRVTEIIGQVSDGLESIAFHPSGGFAVISCLQEDPMLAHDSYSHLAVVDLKARPARVLYYVPVEPYPEGIAFTKDGNQLFVQLTTANHIASFDVEGMMLKRSPFVIRVGHGPSSMGLSPTYHK